MIREPWTIEEPYEPDFDPLDYLCEDCGHDWEVGAYVDREESRYLQTEVRVPVDRQKCCPACKSENIVKKEDLE